MSMILPAIAFAIVTVIAGVFFHALRAKGGSLRRIDKAFLILVIGGLGAVEAGILVKLVFNAPPSALPLLIGATVAVACVKTVSDRVPCPEWLDISSVMKPRSKGASK